MTALRPFFCFYGGKWRDTPRHYPAPAHDTIVEPFAGSAGYSLRYPDRRIVLRDADPIIVGVWDYLIHVTAGEVLAIPDVPMDGSVEDLRIPQEARWLVGFWLNKATSMPCRTPGAWMRSGIRPGSFWGKRVRETIAAQVPHIRHWRVSLGSYEDMPEPGAPATWFVDPPYQLAGQRYRCGASGINFAALGAWCRQRRGQIIVCENEGASWLPFRLLGDVKTARAGSRSREAVWLFDSVHNPT